MNKFLYLQNLFDTNLSNGLNQSFKFRYVRSVENSSNILSFQIFYYLIDFVFSLFPNQIPLFPLCNPNPSFPSSPSSPSSHFPITKFPHTSSNYGNTIFWCIPTTSILIYLITINHILFLYNYFNIFFLM